MKKKTLILVVGIVFLLSGGIIFWQMKGRNSNNQIEQPKSSVLSTEQAKSLVNDIVKNVIGVYENQSKTFKVSDVVTNIEESSASGEKTDEKKNDKENSENEFSDYYIVSNYNEIVKNIFTDNGIKELESTIFDKKNFVLKQDGNIYILKDIPQDNKYADSNVTLGNFEIKEDSISCDVTFSTYGLQEDDTLSYYIYVKNIKLVKKDNSWFVDSFSYKNE